MTKQIEIKCINNNTKTFYPLGTSLTEIIEDQGISLPNRILGARVNNKIAELNYQIYKPKVIEFFDITNPDGMRMYVRSLNFVLIKAIHSLYPEAIIKIEHAVSKGYYCTINGSIKEVTRQMISDVNHKMRKIIAKDLPFERNEMEVEKAVSIFEENKFFEKVKLFRTCPELYTSVYYLDGMADYFYGFLVPSTGYLKVFDLVEYEKGMLLRIPKRDNPEEMEDIEPQKKLFEIFDEYEKWGNIIGARTIGDINEMVENNHESELIKIGEALHEKKVAQIAEQVYSRRDKIKIILVAGPSSSGKTTFSKRLAIQLKVLGLKPVQISLDDYFVNRENTPLDENGEFDFESIDALDVKLLASNYNDLKNGLEVKLPKFRFDTGQRFYTDDTLKLEPGCILIMEGIHGLNPKLTEDIPNDEKYKIYVSALTTLGIDSHNRVPTTDTRLIRRIVRDYKYRGYSALDTLKRWPSVRRGEEKNIFPFQENADIMFNSFLIFELGVLKKYADKLLKEVPEIEYEYSEVNRLLKFLSYFRRISANEIPPTSILREFLYGSTFKYT